MIRSTRDLVMQQDDEPKILRSKNEHVDSECKRHKDDNPETYHTIVQSCNSTIKKYNNYTSYQPLSPSPISALQYLDDKDKVKDFNIRGKSWSDRMDEHLEIEAKKCSHASGGNNRLHNAGRSQHPDLNKENKPLPKWVVKPLETDPRKLQTRQRQIDIGKETAGYKKYIREVRRKDRTDDHPRTPNKYTICSTRSWQGTVRIWRRKLHYWDTPDVAKSQQLKFVNILTSPYMFDEDGSNDEEEVSKPRRIDNSMDNDDCVSEEGSSQNSSDGTESTLAESMRFWSEN